ncbi:IQ-domain [Sarracenia purpurea var. burkii]
MGKKGSWFSAIKRVFIPNSKEKTSNGLEKKSTKEKKNERGILRHGESKSFIPLFRQPSSIEQILGEADQQKLLIRLPTPVEGPQPPPSPRVTSPRVAAPQVVSPMASSSSSRDVYHHKEASYYRPEPTLRYRHLSAIKIQAAYRGYMARRNFRSLRGLVRLQGVVKGRNVRRQTTNAMKMMQLLVRVQTQIQSRRIQMIENQALRHQKNNKELESSLGKWTTNQSEAGVHEDWDDSLLTKEEIEARLQRKVEATIKRERAMAYAYSNQLWKANPTSDQNSLMDIRTGGFPWWWNWLDRHLPPVPPANPSETQTTKSFPSKPAFEPKLSPGPASGTYKQQSFGFNNLEPSKPAFEPKLSPGPASGTYKQQSFGFNNLEPSKPAFEPKLSPGPASGTYKQQSFGFNNLESLTPRSTKSLVPTRTRHLNTPSNRTTTPRSSSSILMKYPKTRAGAAGSAAFDDVPLKDNDSLTSCPAFSVPNYMVPTISAKAKARASSINPRDSFLGTPSGDSKRRFSFSLTPNFGSFKWNKGSSSKDSTSQRVLEKQYQSFQSVGDGSIDSAISMPAAVGRKPFNRFV